ncbi:hypothetical protein [Oribacterium sp. C9]|uniref:hypothetical protein n=1 Tax=Oribacterium sp. C9 TaxID=1943579 RepID=UPI0011156DBD|nr:hypothetical protein [Oribacterium sp. C9]
MYREMGRETERKCDTCKYCMSNYSGTFCGCVQSSEYGLFSVYGWCEQYERDVKYGGVDKTSLRKEFYINDMSITFKESMTHQQMSELFEKALKSIGVVNQIGSPA